jgi:hypothetical protein
MAHVFALTDKKTGKLVMGGDFIKIDEDICKHLGVPVDPVDWHKGWMDRIGYSMAALNDFTKSKECFKDCPDMLEILEYLEENYEPASFRD